MRVDGWRGGWQFRGGRACQVFEGAAPAVSELPIAVLAIMRAGERPNLRLVNLGTVENFAEGSWHIRTRSARATCSFRDNTATNLEMTRSIKVNYGCWPETTIKQRVVTGFFKR